MRGPITLGTGAHFHPGCLREVTIALLSGSHLGTGCVVHPKCTVIAASAPIVFGQGCIVEEYAIIVNRYAQDLTLNEVSHQTAQDVS